MLLNRLNQYIMILLRCTTFEHIVPTFEHKIIHDWAHFTIAIYLRSKGKGLLEISPYLTIKDDECRVFDSILLVLGQVSYCHQFSSVVRPSTFHILIFSSDTIGGCGGHLGRRYEMPDTILEGDHPRIISEKFGRDWLSSFRGKDFF
jgi:hypothetical protein